MNQGGGGLVMPLRKRQEPSPGWQCADKEEVGVCQKMLKTSFGSKSAIVQHMGSNHHDKEAVKVLHAPIVMREATSNEHQAVGLPTNHVGKRTVGCWSPSKMNLLA